MKRVTRNNMLKYIQMKKDYIEKPDEQLLKEINTFTEEVINKDKSYYHKLSSYNLDKEDLEYCM